MNEDTKKSENILDTLEQGELILVSPYKDDRFMILGEFYKPASLSYGQSFYSEKVAILGPLRSWQIVPDVSEEIDNPYVLKPTMFDHPPINGYEIPLTPLQNGKFYVGLVSILEVLEKTAGYEPHAASLAASLRVPETLSR